MLFLDNAAPDSCEEALCTHCGNKRSRPAHVAMQPEGVHEGEEAGGRVASRGPGAMRSLSFQQPLRSCCRREGKYCGGGAQA